MDLGALAANAALQMIFGAKQRENADAPDFAAAREPANIARAAQNVPASAAQVSMDAILFLQSDAPADVQSATRPTPTELFLAEIQKDPIERMREQILEELGLTEESLADLPSEERRAMEDRISAMIEEKLRQGFGAARAPETAAEALTQALRG